MGEIARQLRVSKSSVSYWVRDIKLTNSQRKKLNENGHSIDAIEKRRIARLKTTQNRRKLLVESALKEATSLKFDPLWCVGVSLYWGEGGKTQNMTRLSNSDPEVIRLMMNFFRKICRVPEQKFRGHVHTFSHLNAASAENYWSRVSNIPKKNFYKTYVKKSSASKDKRDTLQYGTFQIYIHDTKLFFRIMGWIEYLKKNYS